MGHIQRSGEEWGQWVHVRMDVSIRATTRLFYLLFSQHENNTQIGSLRTAADHGHQWQSVSQNVCACASTREGKDYLFVLRNVSHTVAGLTVEPCGCLGHSNSAHKTGKG